MTIFPTGVETARPDPATIFPRDMETDEVRLPDASPPRDFRQRYQPDALDATTRDRPPSNRSQGLREWRWR